MPAPAQRWAREGTDRQPDRVVVAVLDEEQFLAALGVTRQRAVREAPPPRLIEGEDDDARSPHRQWADTEPDGDRAALRRALAAGLDTRSRTALDAPDRTRETHGRALYARFAAHVAAHGGTTVEAITAPTNTGSVAFHQRLGFTATLVEQYAGPGQDRIHFAVHVRTLLDG